jgi:hypothetical protein
MNEKNRQYQVSEQNSLFNNVIEQFEQPKAISQLEIILVREPTNRIMFESYSI